MTRHFVHPTWLLLAIGGCGSAMVAGSQTIESRPSDVGGRAAEPTPERKTPAEVAAKVAHTTPTKAKTKTTRPTTRVPLSTQLPNGLYNPMPGGVMAGYRGDTGLDIAGNRMPVYAIASGTLDYSEPGHTRWTGARDTNNTVRLALDQPIRWGDRQITHVWYAYLSALTFHQPEDAPERLRIAGGEQLGVSGVANGSPHLHLGLLLDNVVSQRWGSFLLEDDCRDVLGGWKKGQRLPELPAR